jgi:hypothetical protein
MEKPAEGQSFTSHFSFISSIGKVKRKKPWLYWTFFYSLFVFAALDVTVFYVAIGYPALGFSNTDINSARYLLSAIIQSEASIIAIVISLTLVAMQLVASSYSPRVARIFSSGSQMYIILLFYVASIAYSAVILQTLQGESGPISPVFDYLVSFSLWFAIFLMIALVPYIRNILTLLQPDTIISREYQRISKDTILSTPSQYNPLDLIFGILHQSVMRYDTGLVQDQLPQVTRAVINVLSEPLTDTEIIGITQDYSRRLTVYEQQSIQLDDLESSRIILENIKDVANCTIALVKDDASRQVIESIQLLEKASANKKSWNTLTHIIEVLEECGKNAIDKNLERTTAGICMCLKQVTQDSIDLINPDADFGPFYRLAERTIDIVSGLAHSAITDNRIATLDTIIVYLVDIWKYCWNKKRVQFVHSVADKILDVWLLAVENKLENIQLPVAAYNAYHSRKLWVKRDKSALHMYENKVMRIGIFAHVNDMKDSTQGAVRLLADFRLIDAINYNENLNRYYEGLKDEKEKAAYLHVFELSVKFKEEKSTKSTG